MADEQERESESQPVDNSADLDIAIVFRSGAHDAEMEALAVRGLLESNGIPSSVVGPSTIPSLEFQVTVPQEYLETAQRALEEARAAGPQAAEEAEKAGEGIP